MARNHREDVRLSGVSPTPLVDLRVVEIRRGSALEKAADLEVPEATLRTVGF